jgi:integrase
MFPEPTTSAATLATYNRDADRFVAQYCREVEEDPSEIPYETRLVLTARWFLESHGRWSKAHVVRTALALSWRLGLLVRQEMVDDPGGPEKSLLSRLKNDRPAAHDSRKGKEKIDCSSSKKFRRSVRKSAQNAELRRLINFFREQGDAFSLWIAGYLQIASRIGWRPGEVVALRREGRYLHAPAEKNTNGRGLTPCCEVIISSYPTSVASRIDQWILETAKWAELYDGEWYLRRVINGRLARACDRLGIKSISTATLRHFAIACMKASKFSPAEIAVLVNHKSSKTAAERYGKARTGFRRAKKMLRFQEEKLLLVRDKARPYTKAFGAADPLDLKGQPPVGS